MKFDLNVGEPRCSPISQYFDHWNLLRTAGRHDAICPKHAREPLHFGAKKSQRDKPSQRGRAMTTVRVVERSFHAAVAIVDDDELGLQPVCGPKGLVGAFDRYLVEGAPEKQVRVEKTALCRIVIVRDSEVSEQRPLLTDV